MDFLDLTTREWALSKVFITSLLSGLRTWCVEEPRESDDFITGLPVAVEALRSAGSTGSEVGSIMVTGRETGKQTQKSS